MNRLKNTVRLAFALLVSTLMLMSQVAVCQAVSEPVVSDNTGSQEGREIVFIDAAVPDQDYFIKRLPADVPAYIIGPRENGIDRILSVLSGLATVDEVHVVSHGSPGEVMLGNQTLSSGSMDRLSEKLGRIGDRLAAGGDILLYGCNVAMGDQGKRFLRQLAATTGADVAASNNFTGMDRLGADWQLEVAVGRIDGKNIVSDALRQSYPHVLATFDFENATDNGATVTQTVTGVTLTVSTSNLDASMVDDGGVGGSSGIVVYPDTDVTSMTFSFSQAVDITSLRALDFALFTTTTWTFTPTGGSNSTVDQLVSGDTGTTVALNWTGVTSFTITLQGGGNFGFEVDTLLFTIAPPDPTITSAAYDASTGALVVTGANLEVNAGGADIDVSDLTFTGEGGDTYTLTSSGDVEITSAFQFTVNLDATDQAAVEQILNKNGTASTGGTVYNLAAADDWNTNVTSGDSSDTTGNGITVSNVTAPTVTSATYNYGTNQLTLAGTGFLKRGGAANDVDVSMLTITGEGGTSYTLTSATDVEIDSGTQFTVTLSGVDLTNVEALLNKDGTTSATAGTTYNLAAAEDWAAGADAAVVVADTTGNAITVSNYAAPTVTSATYDFSTSVLTVTGTQFVSRSGAANDIDVSMLTITGEGGAIFTLISATDVEITSATTFALTLSASDRLNVNGLLNKNGTSSDDATTYNLAAADNWMAGTPAGNNIADAATGITVSNYAVPTVTSATYNFNTNVLTVTGTQFVSKSGAANDIDVSMLTVTGEGGATYTLTSAADVEITSATAFSVTLSGADLTNVEALLNKDGTTSATAGTTYNLAAADNWMAQAVASNDIADATGNAITVSNVALPSVTSATYDSSTGALVVTGTNFVSNSGPANDLDASLLTFTGEGGGTHILTDTPDVEVTSATSANLTLSATDRSAVNGLLNKDGTSSDDATTYNLAAADNWMAGAPAGNNITDAATGITMSNYAVPTVTSATYDFNTNVLTVTGTQFVRKSGAANDIDVSMLTVTGEGDATYTLTSAADVEIVSDTAFSVTLSGADLTNVEALLNKDGTTSATAGTTYNLAAADNWMAQAAASKDIADATGNAITVSNVAVPKVTSATYDSSTGVLVVTGTNFVSNSGPANDVDASLLTFIGEGGGTYTLTATPDVEITSATTFSLTLSASDRLNVNGLLNKNGTASGGATTYNLAAGDNWLAGAPAAVDVADLTGNGITVSNVATPTITSATYDSDTGELVLTGTNLFKQAGAANDVDISALTVTGEGGTYTITSATDVEIDSATQFTFTLSGADKTNVDARLNQVGTTSSGGTTYNLAAADNWLTAADTAANIADLAGNGITVTILPRITSATYNVATRALVVTGTNIQANGAGVDIDASRFTFTGEGGDTCTLTNTADVERTSITQFTLSLSPTDRAAVNQMMNKNGTSATDGTVYNLAAADDWCTNVTAGDTSDATDNGITVSNVPVPDITSATYDGATGVMAVTGTGLLKAAGAANDIDASLFTITGEGGGAYTLTDTPDVEVDSGTAFTLTLSAGDRASVNLIVNRTGTASIDNTTYNLAAAEDWAVGADAAVTVADTTGNGITASNVFGIRAVANTDDSGAGSLREAILDASPGDTIDLSGLSGTITLTTGALVVGENLEINGSTANRLVISGNAASRVFNISVGTVTLSDLTIVDGSTVGNGGGIANAGDLTLVRVTVSGNTTTGDGGGVSNTGTLTANNCTVSGNTAVGNGGGIAGGGTMQINNCTIAANAATSTGGIYNIGTLHLSNTIVADNTSGDCTNTGTLATNTNNLTEDGSCTPGLSGDPVLGPLQDNGGSTFTHALMAGSIAIDAADAGTAESTDQRGIGRPVDGDNIPGAVADMGAFEFSSGALQFSAALYNANEGSGSATVTVTRTGGADGTVSVDYATGGGSATAASDYTSVFNTLNWPHGDVTDKTFTVSLVDDSTDEADETVNLSLGGFAGAGQGSPTSAVLTIVDNDTAPGPPAPAPGTSYTLTVTVADNGSGSVTSDPAGIDCGSDCTEVFAAGTTVALTATAAGSSSTFTGWSGGDCSGIGECTTVLDADRTITARFAPRDSDGDGTPDHGDTFPDDPTEASDNDNDGLGDIADPDDDNDSMPDAWELLNGLAPLTGDADLDADGDGLTNLQEYEKGTDPMAVTPGPGVAVLIAPENPSADQDVDPVLVSGYTDTAIVANHDQTQWQIATDADFHLAVFSVTAANFKTGIAISPGTLKAHTTYYWRVRYIDTAGISWSWSRVGVFDTGANPWNDSDINGIPDEEQLLPGTFVDLDGDGHDDIGRPDMLVITMPTGNGEMGLLAGSNVDALELLSGLLLEEISEEKDRPSDCPLGLYNFRLRVSQPGATATVTLFFSMPIPDDAVWHNYDTINGWDDFSDRAVIRSDRLSVSVELTDGGWGDADGVANGIIVDPSGPGLLAMDDAGGDSGDDSGGDLSDDASGDSGGDGNGDIVTSGGSGGGGGCFIGSVSQSSINPAWPLSLLVLFFIVVATFP